MSPLLILACPRVPLRVDVLHALVKLCCVGGPHQNNTNSAQLSCLRCLRVCGFSLFDAPSVHLFRFQCSHWSCLLMRVSVNRSR